MRILITGATGFIGQHLLAALGKSHAITLLSRDTARAKRVLNSSAYQYLTLDELDSLDGFDAIINLAGEPIANKRWSAAQKQRICESRWQLTEALLELLRHCTNPPRIWLNASAVGFYGRQDSHPLDEDETRSHPEFSHEVCRRWEELALEARDYGCRVCIVRIGVVLGVDGGALAKMLPAYRLGLGGPLGDGQQYLSWIALPDVIAVFLFLLGHDNCHGIYNATSPHAVPQQEFSRLLAQALRRPHWLRTPAWLLRLLLGELADLLLYGQNVVPQRLLEAGFQFQHPKLISALKHALKTTHNHFSVPEA
jgi:uncharacterized protein (TIGR01777 family)